TVKRVPLKRGLDLRGGMHLALEIDDSQGAVGDREDALMRAERVVRSRIDQFGVSEPLVQRVGGDRLIIELPGIDDPERAIEVVQQSAFLQFQITDRTQAMERVAPRLDAIARELDIGVPAGASGDTAVRTTTGLEGLLSADSLAADTTATDQAGAVAPGD